jgi:hypothetical protein
MMGGSTRAAGKNKENGIRDRRQPDKRKRSKEKRDAGDDGGSDGDGRWGVLVMMSREATRELLSTTEGSRGNRPAQAHSDAGDLGGGGATCEAGARLPVLGSTRLRTSDWLSPGRPPSAVIPRVRVRNTAGEKETPRYCAHADLVHSAVHLAIGPLFPLSAPVGRRCLLLRAWSPPSAAYRIRLWSKLYDRFSNTTLDTVHDVIPPDGISSVAAAPRACPPPPRRAIFLCERYDSALSAVTSSSPHSRTGGAHTSKWLPQPAGTGPRRLPRACPP